MFFKHSSWNLLTLRILCSPPDLRQEAGGRKHSTGHPTGTGPCWRNPPPLGRLGNTCLLQPPLRVPTPGLYRVVSSCALLEVKAAPHPLWGLGRSITWWNAVTTKHQQQYQDMGNDDRRQVWKKVHVDICGEKGITIYRQNVVAATSS